MRPFTNDELLALGPRAIAQLKEQGISLPSSIAPEELKDLEEIHFRYPVKAVNSHGSAIEIGTLEDSWFVGRLIDKWYDNHSATSGWVKYELPWPKENRIVTTTISNVERR